jgi:hypothetical protein
MKETTTVTRIPTDTTTIEKTREKTTEKTTPTITQKRTQTTISHPKGDSNHTNQETNSTSGLVIKEKETETETISQQNFYDIPIERRIPSAIILGIIVPASCILIILLVHGNTYLIVRIGRYIATNIEPKINDLYFNNLPSGQKPIVWESYMQTFKIEAEENNWVTVVFGGIALVANVGGIFSAVNILNNIVFSPILLVPLGIFIFLLWWVWETKKNMVELRDGEGSLRKIWYKGINRENKEVKSTRIFWKSNYRVWEMYQINDFKNLFNEIKNYSRNPEYNPPFYFNLDDGRRKRINNIPELLELCIDNPNKFKEYMEKEDFENWLDNIEIRETELANIAQATRKKTFPNDNERLHYFLRECCLVLIGRNL